MNVKKLLYKKITTRLKNEHKSKLTKFKDWVEGDYFENIGWEEFYEDYHKCNNCDHYYTEQCLCYTR